MSYCFQCFIVCSLLVVSCLAEPPVNNRYLPPQARNAAPSQSYGVPGFSQRQAEAVFNGRPSSAYAPPASIRKPNSQYGLPKTPSSTVYQIRIDPMFPLKNMELLDLNEVCGSDSKYDNQQSRQYLPPSARGYDDGSSGEPANYDFEYMVQDAPSGNDFGHRESRRGDRAEGVYYVVLPDGRKQTVEYEADQDGFKPRISYEDVGAGSGYDSSRQADYNNDNTNGPY
ncbi:putative cuticle protein CPR151 [Danaus plexippus plexippus]|uniref:Cuticle protein CPR151 n=1 Tax=Danaus plexippus plexippus TaxID=278856 RepID=A0A212FK66_DANPL|nr:putative cuticle protein CPR151 [Danaus plexippus plexippus]